MSQKLKIAALLGLAFTANHVSAEKQPNIVYIICDDLGYGDVQFLNPERGKIPTPNIDKLATQGMTFTDAHGGSSVCTPTRYGILTGRYAWRSRLQEGVLGGGKEFEPLIAENRLTVPALLKKAGYQTACMGKWHLGFHFVDSNGKILDLGDEKKAEAAPIGSMVPDGPITRGFDSYFGFHHSASMETVIRNNNVIDHQPPIKMLGSLATEACKYISEEAGKKQAFFLYIALNSPHSPVVPSEKWQGKSGMGDYADFVMETDDAIGQVIAALEASGIAENTLLFVTSDNGCSYPAAKGKQLETQYGHFASAQFRGSKSDIWDGGHRIPFIVRWPGKVEANSKNNTLICLTSLMATCAEITGTKMPKNAGEDSYSILPLLTGNPEKFKAEPVVHHSIQGKFSIRDGNWKLEFCPGSGGWSDLTDSKARKQGLPELQLYNMQTDESEQNNVFKEYPEIVNKLTSELKEIIKNGRSTSGKKQKNDVPIDLFKVNN